MSTSPAAPSGRASPPPPGPPRPAESRPRRHAAQQHPADRRPCRARRQAQGRRRQVHVDVGSGAARSRATWASCAGCTTPACSASSASCCTPASTSSPTCSGRARPVLEVLAGFHGAADRARRGLRGDRPGAAAHGERYADFLVPAARRGERGDRARHRERPVDRRPGARSAPVVRRRAADDPAPAARGCGHRRDLPALPGLHRRGDRRRRHPVQVLPADPRGGQPRRLWQGLPTA